MINGVSNCFSSLSMTGSRNIQKPPPPPQEKDLFKSADVDGNGVFSQSELETVLEGIKKVTGDSISVEDAINSYDANQDGALSGEELLGLIGDSGLLHPGPPEGEGGQVDMFPSMQASSEEAIVSYTQNSGQDPIAQLRELLQNSADGSQNSTLLHITT